MYTWCSPKSRMKNCAIIFLSIALLNFTSFMANLFMYCTVKMSDNYNYLWYNIKLNKLSNYVFY